MKSPFPGMDPYLEKHWGDVHSRFVLYACDQMQSCLPSDLYARVEERDYLENDGIQGRNMLPDVRVIENGHGGPTKVAVEGNVAVAEPYVLYLENEPITETFIEIHDANSGNRVITVIE